MMVSASDLQYFVEVANTLNFSRASERIGISQPSLSAAMKRLEQALDVSLFIRSKNGVTLTKGGKRLLAHTRQLLQMWDTVKSECQASHDEVQGCFRFGCHTSVALYGLSAFLPAFLEQHPQMEIQLEHDLSRKILEEVVNFSVDIALVVNPVRHPDLIIQKLYEDEVTFWCTREPNAGSGLLDSGHAVIICDPDLAQTQWLLKYLHREGLQYKRVITSSSLEVVAKMTASGNGIGILPACVARSVCPGLLNPLPDMPKFNDEICLVYRHENRSVKAMQVLVESVKQHFAKGLHLVPFAHHADDVNQLTLA